MRRASPARGREQTRRPSLVPVLPARDAVHFPGMIATLQVARDPSIKALRRSLDGDRLVIVLSQRDMAVEEPSAGDLHRVGTLSETLQALPLPDGSQRATLRGLRRVGVSRLTVRGGVFWAEIRELPEVVSSDPSVDALCRACISAFSSVVQLHRSVPAEALDSVAHLDQPGALADAIAHHLPATIALKQELLEQPDVSSRLERLLEALKREEQVLRLEHEIHGRVEAQLGTAQREYTLREQLKIIQEELKERDDRASETEDYEARIDAAQMPEAIATKARAEVARLDRMPAASPEGAVARNWLDTLLSMPWGQRTEDCIDVSAAAEVLSREHYGLTPVKERILDHIAVRQLTRSLRGPILCFVGPPGVGKTSIGRSIGQSMGRRFARLSLGGVRDEAEIRGHRRTYVGAMPGRIVQTLRQAGTANPVIMLDEIDKLGSDWRGDPTSALLEALDPEQNCHFEDHYLDAPFDLSAVLFIATANTVDAIPPALRDRLEIIQFPGYSDEERVRIARDYLVPKITLEHGLSDIEFGDEALVALAQDYTRESGVRELERQIAAACRKLARERVEGRQPTTFVRADTLLRLLGHPRLKRAEQPRLDLVGEATGLVVAEYGGETVRVEASLVPPHSDKPELRLTGRLGDVMRESAEAALTWVRANAERLCPEKAFHYDVHVHVTDAGIPKDGPSAGLTIAITLASAFTGKAIRGDVAMTGEVTLRGRVLPVGGIREKLLAARRSGVTCVLLPRENMADAADVAAEALADLKLCFVATIDEALDEALVPASVRASLA